MFFQEEIFHCSPADVKYQKIPSNAVILSLSINALHACVYIYIRQLNAFGAPTLWFIDLTVATCQIQYTFLSLF